MHQLFIATSLQLLLPVIQQFFFGAEIFNLQKKKTSKIKCHHTAEITGYAVFKSLSMKDIVHSKCINDHTLRSDIFLPKCPTHSREMSDKFESQHSPSPTIWSDIVVGRESGYLKIFFYISRGEHVKHVMIDAYLTRKGSSKVNI